MAAPESSRTQGARTSAKAASPWLLQDYCEQLLVSAEEQQESPLTAEGVEAQLDAVMEARLGYAAMPR